MFVVRAGGASAGSGRVVLGSDVSGDFFAQADVVAEAGQVLVAPGWVAIVTIGAQVLPGGASTVTISV
ncbi:hypothetical protein [Nonomuraea sp. NPDC049141]|uniref:hypothetical protein n=1 Tax=Nonomuraea sp. NPDC049141 TaxID=3155500 RepID=UPI0033FCA799